MNKSLKIILTVALVIGVFVLAFLVTGKQPVKVISYDDFSKINSNDGIVYYGSKESKDILKEIALKAEIEIGILDSSESKTNKLKENTLYQYKDGKLVYKYSGDLDKITDPAYKTISLKQYKNVIREKGYHFMFIGSATCGHCTNFKESLKTVYLKELFEGNSYKAYYIDISTLTEDEVQELVKTDSYMSENEWGTPLNILYKSGKRVDVLSGYVEASELVNFLKENKVI